jgi:hypothetical protein
MIVMHVHCLASDQMPQPQSAVGSDTTAFPPHLKTVRDGLPYSAQVMSPMVDLNWTIRCTCLVSTGAALPWRPLLTLQVDVLQD